jgi:serine/threonine-protein kinase
MAARRKAVRIGSYELLMQLASGGMASVHIARHVGPSGFERLVVVKRVHPHMLQEEGFRAMFCDEARVASLVRHPNVAQLLDVVDWDGELLIVLEYVESVSLALIQRRATEFGARLPVPVALRIVCDMLAGLHAAHEAKDARGRSLDIVHRDVSPQNVIVGVDGIGRLIDFGIAQAAARVTRTTGGVLKGKLAYMSPEQSRGVDLDRRSDLFSAGVVLHEALTGRPLFQRDGKEGSNVLLNILLDPVPDPSTIVPGIPPELDAVVQVSLERVRSERFQTAAEFAGALETAGVQLATRQEVAATLERFGGETVTARREAIQRILSGLADPVLTAGASGAGSARPPLRRGRVALFVVPMAVAISVGAVASQRTLPSRLQVIGASSEVVTAAEVSVRVSTASAPSASEPPVPAVLPAVQDASAVSVSKPSIASPRRAPRAPPSRGSAAPPPPDPTDLHLRNPY